LLCCCLCFCWQVKLLRQRRIGGRKAKQIGHDTVFDMDGGIVTADAPIVIMGDIIGTIIKRCVADR